MLPDPEDLLSELAFRCPELGPALARVRVTWDTSIPTACVDGAGHVKINPALADIAIQILAHEIMHLVGEHFVDMPPPAYDPLGANIAGDIWLNGILQELMPQLEWPADWLYPNSDQRTMTAREIYASFGGKAKGKPKLGAGCGVEGGNPTPADGQGVEATDSANPVDRATAGAVMAGIGSCLPRVDNMITPPPPRTSIPEVLQEAAKAASGHTRPQATFTRLGRRSTPMVPRRGRRKWGPAIVVIVDISGSMSSYLDRIRRECIGLAKRAKVHLILHDAAVLFSGRVGMDDIVKRISPAGGTSFHAAFVEAGRVLRDWNLQGAVVHFTDGEVDTWGGPPAAVPCYAAVVTSATAPVPWRTRRLAV